MDGVCEGTRKLAGHHAPANRSGQQPGDEHEPEGAGDGRGAQERQARQCAVDGGEQDGHNEQRDGQHEEREHRSAQLDGLLRHPAPL